MKNFKTDVRKDIKVNNPAAPVPSKVISFIPVKHAATKQRPTRPGKTAKDHKSGAHARHLQNQINRAIKQQDK